jgi:phosphatidylserine/phosphatidylglycerophosphate/cardiolipin synthase-like enzyme
VTATTISSKLSCIFLQGTSGHQQPIQDQVTGVANALAEFIAAAKRSLRIAIYDFRLKENTAGIVLGAIRKVAANGVDVSIGYDAGKTPDNQETFSTQGGDPAPSGNAEFLSALEGVRNVRTEAIDGHHNLMHSKYVIRDAGTQGAVVWMGSTNFTDDAWGRQENNILMLASPLLAGFYQNDFLELFAQAGIQGTGKDDTGDVQLPDQDKTDVMVQFSPGQGKQIDSSIAESIRNAKKRVRIASMVISSGTVLGAILDSRDAGVDVQGVFDGTQMAGALKSIERAGDRQGKAALFEQATKGFAQKKSTPFTAHGAHDFMHNKIAVVDDAVITGSFNFSTNATKNAENCVRVESEALAEAYVKYIDGVIERYSTTG